MKRGVSSTISSRRPSSGRSANPHAADDVSQPSSASAPSPPPPPQANSPASAAGASAVRGEGSNYLVALAGMRALESHVQDLSRGKKWRDRVTSWEERAGLGLPSVKLALGFLDVLGVSRASVYKQLLENSLRALLDQIPHLSEERMLLLLNDSFRYATQPELKSVPLKIITSMSVVPDKVLEKIIELQTHEPAQFEELGLPLAIKRLAWEKDAKLFVRIVSPHADKYIASEYAPKMIAASQQVRFYKHLDTIKRRKLMGPQRITALAECTGGRPILIGFLCDEMARKFKEESSLAKAGMWATLLTDVLVTARERAYGSIADQSVDRLCALASRLDLAVREDVFGDAAVREVQRLFREATGIGEGQQEPAKGTRRATAQEKAKQEDESTKLRKILKSAWSSVSKMDTQQWFKEPVTEAIAQGYHKVVKTPMDLGTILKKIKGGGYPSFGDFDRDLRLMWENCRVYNGPGTPFYKEASRLEDEWSKVSGSFEDTLRRHETRAPAAPAASSGSSNNNKRKSTSSMSTQQQQQQQQQQDDARGSSSGGTGAGAPLTAMAPATQLDGAGLGRRVGLAAMLLSEPFVAKLMYRHASERVPEACREREMLPRDHPTFAPLLQLLELGDAARAMFRAGSFGVRAVEDGLTKRVLPCLVALHARSEDAIARRGGSGSSKVGDGATGGGGSAADGSAGAAVPATASDEDDAAGVAQDWKTWYREFPAVRRVICTMLCRALVRGGDEAAALMLPAARAAVRKMADERWLWASLEGLVKNSASAPVPAGGKGKEGEKDKAGRFLEPETLTSILELFSRGLESATVSDAVFAKSLELVTALLPTAFPPPATAAAHGTGSSSSSSTAAAAASSTQDASKKPRGVPRGALEQLVDKAAARAARPSRKPRTEAEEKRVNEAFERVFARAPKWRSKLSEKRKAVEAAAAATAAAAAAAKTAKAAAAEAVAAAAAAAAAAESRRARANRGGGGVGRGGKPPPLPSRPPRSFSIKGPKRKAEDGSGGGSRGDAAPVPRKRSRG